MVLIQSFYKFIKKFSTIFLLSRNLIQSFKQFCRLSFFITFLNYFHQLRGFISNENLFYGLQNAVCIALIIFIFKSTKLRILNFHFCIFFWFLEANWIIFPYFFDFLICLGFIWMFFLNIFFLYIFRLIDVQNKALSLIVVSKLFIYFNNSICAYNYFDFRVDDDSGTFTIRWFWSQWRVEKNYISAMISWSNQISICRIWSL